ncbi:cell wall metabolism sensor histidine kinase WalK, partial [Staphylococcus sp. EG-SA-26]|uniref:cell wall metabolism sensor histidine kinase WalK n=1 Tax=Staphylococcus sp. EG-SA-26 TaxID=2767498 RepID=UPI001F11E3E6
FGVALSGAVYAIVSNMTNIYTGAMIALWLNAGMGILSFVIILYLRFSILSLFIITLLFLFNHACWLICFSSMCL